MALAGVADVETHFGPVPDESEGRVGELLELAEAQVRQRFPDLDARMTAGRTSAPLVRQVLGEMVAAVLRNPEGVRSTSRTEVVGPFNQSQSQTYSSNASGLLELTARQARMLGARRGAVTVPMADPALPRVAGRDFRGPWYPGMVVPANGLDLPEDTP